jgi:hypothetical protein
MKSFTRLWERLSRVAAPVDIDAATVRTPALAPMLQDQFADGQQQRAYRQQEQRRETYDRVVKANNAYVYRDYGLGRVTLVDETKQVEQLSTDERADLKQYEIHMTDKPNNTVVTHDEEYWLEDHRRVVPIRRADAAVTASDVAIGSTPKLVGRFITATPNEPSVVRLLEKWRSEGHSVTVVHPETLPEHPDSWAKPLAIVVNIPHTS